MPIFDQFRALSPALPWLAGSFAAYVLAANLLWLARLIARRAARPGREPGRAARAGHVAGVVGCEAGRFLYYLGLPYLALGGWPRQPMQGVMTVQDMGLVIPFAAWPVARWLDSLGTGVGLGAGALALLLLAWAGANRRGEGPGLRFPPRPWWALLADVLYLEIHWAFYRAALALLLGDAYAAAFAGLGLVWLEWALDPLWRAGWRREGRAAGQWLRAALALVVAVLYILTRNLWVCFGVHLVMEMACWRIGRRPGEDVIVTQVSSAPG